MTDALPDAARILAAVRATWPPSALHSVGPFDLPAEREGSRRGTAARLRPDETVKAADIDAVEAARPGTVFSLLAGDDDGTADLLATRGYRMTGGAELLAGPVAPLLDETPPVSGFPHWPPLAICDDLWGAHGNPADRRAPMHRAPDPRTAILLRLDDRAAGALFVGIHDGLAICHMVLTLPQVRRRGVGLLGLRHAARWAEANGAAHLALPVEADNVAALALYGRAGLVRRGGYRYWSLP